jgi:hypothetical protein
VCLLSSLLRYFSVAACGLATRLSAHCSVPACSNEFRNLLVFMSRSDQLAEVYVLELLYMQAAQFSEG